MGLMGGRGSEVTGLGWSEVKRVQIIKHMQKIEILV
jgi:hypothetical protein